MAELPIGVNILPQIARQQHALEWLQRERARLQGELAYITQASERAEGELLSFLNRVYAIDPKDLMSIDADRGVIVVKDPDPEPAQPAPPEQPMGPLAQEES